jgi:hypothetical protein
MDLKDTMHDNPRSERQACARIRPGRRGFSRGFSICLFLVVLAVCGWVMHRRLSQYDTPQQAIHQSTSIKVTVTKRNPISVPSQHGTDAIALFLLAFAITATLKSPENSKTAVAYRVQRDQSDQHADVSMRRRLDRFFLLPPPSLFSEL